MKVIMFSWEYPPKSVGGLAQHVYDLTSALTEKDHEIDLITVGSQELPPLEIVNGVKVHRVSPYPLNPPHFIPWIIQLNISMLEKAVSLFNSNYYDLIHAHDWLVAFAGRSLKHIYKIPLVATIHATEYGRNQGLHNEDQNYISDVEWWLAFEAWKVICCSSYMKKDLKKVFGLPEDKLRVIYNGVDIENYKTDASKGAIKTFRKQFATSKERIVFFVGRLVQEKGVQVLLEAAPRILNYCPQTKFVISGKGPMMEELKNKISSRGIDDKVIFTGYIDDETRNLLYASSDVAVFPSLYEPFGIVALEGMATRTPVVVSDTGGFSEIVNHGVDGYKALPGNPGSLADNILKVLMDETTAQKISHRAYRKVRDSFTWQEIAGNTEKIYEEVLSSYMRSSWSKEAQEVHEKRVQSVNQHPLHYPREYNLYQQEGDFN